MEAALWSAGALALGYVLLAHVEREVVASRLRSELESASRMVRAEARVVRPDVPADPARPDPGELRVLPREIAAPAIRLAPGDLVGSIEVPRIGLEAMIVEGVRPRDLEVAVGHVPGTALPGGSGPVAIAGHRDAHFRPLEEVRPGDGVVVTTPRGTHHYQVTATRVVLPADTHVITGSAETRLVLITCYPFRWVGPAPKRMVVEARPRPYLAAAMVAARR